MKKVILVIGLTFILTIGYSQKKKQAATTTKTVETVRVVQNDNQSKNNSSRSASFGFEKRDIFASGAFGYQSQGDGTGKEGTFAILPSVGYFISDNIALGVAIGYKNTTTSPIGVDSSTNSEFTGGLMARYYAMPASQFSFFGQGGFEFISQSFEGGGSATGFGVNLKPGINYFISSHFSLEATVGEFGFTSLKAKGASDPNTNFNLGLNLKEIGFGLNYKF